jgi:hypothetical protein
MNPREKAVFEAKQIMRLGSEDPVCVLCGERNPLRLVLPNGHHVTGRKRDPKFQEILCASCHQELHLLARLKGALFGKREGPLPARTAARLRALALSRDMEAEHLRHWANESEAHSTGGDGERR